MTFTECEHGDVTGILSCPACQRSAPEPVVIYQRAEALFSGRCPLPNCGRPIYGGQRIALVGEDRQSAVWAHEGCAGRARDG